MAHKIRPMKISTTVKPRTEREVNLAMLEALNRHMNNTGSVAGNVDTRGYVFPRGTMSKRQAE